MKKVFYLFFALFLSMNSYADGMYACMQDFVYGADWKNQRWSSANFFEKKIIIKVINGGRNIEFKKGESGVDYMQCSKLITFSGISCSTSYGTTVLFDEVTLNGANSELLGAVMPKSSQRDSLSVSYFSCQKF